MKTKHSVSINYSNMNCTKLTLFMVVAVTLQFLGLCLFIMGFFPVKATLTGISGLESLYPPGFDPPDLIHNDISSLQPEKLKSLYQELSGVPPLYDRLIFMVIDGLPAEFVLGKDGKPPSKVFKEAMPFTMSLLDEGMAIGYHAKAAPPTVTMPRLKAMVSGAIGGFLDVAFNFNTQAFLDDNLIAQFLRFGWKMVMLGDETWLKLFPGMFTRHDGVSSFFVKDTVEVDHNVSRHLTNELNKTDWDLLILHYLGLDHVGHIGGRNSFLMAPKLMEMDEVIKRIHSSITKETLETNRRTLLMIVSDHGMTEGGNHGGSSFEETDSLAVFVGANKFSAAPEFNNKAYQVDIAVTLALLFGVPIPRNNVGTAMAEVFISLKEEQKLKILQLNSWQLLRLLQTHSIDLGCEQLYCSSKSERENDPERFCCSYLSAVSSHESWKSRNFSRSDNEDDYNNIAAAYAHFLTTASAWLSSRATDKPMGHLASGIGAMLVSCFILTTLFRRCDQDVNGKCKWCLDEYFVLAVILILVLSMGSSSMIEEEQYIWHFMTSSLYLILLRKSLQYFTCALSQPFRCSDNPSYHQMSYIVLVLIAGRILRAWHQGGVNWSHLPDVAKYLDQAGLVYLKSLQTIASFLIVFICLAVLLALRLKIRVIVTLILIYLFPVSLILKQIYQDSAYTSSTTIQTIYALLGISTLSVFFATPWLATLLHKTRSISSQAIYESQKKFLLGGFRDSILVIGWCYIFSWCLLQLLLQQPVNAIPLALLLVQIVGSFQYFSHGNVHLKKWVKVAALYYIGMEGHFGLGNTNTLATIDVAGAFMGISSHSTIISGILMFTITYASPILAILSMVMDVDDLSSFANDQNVVFGDLLQTAVGYTCLVPLAFNSILLLAYTIVLLLMQNHLFVWSVFSPKYLYVCATTACVYIGVSIVALTAAYTCMVFTIRMRWKGSR